MIDITYYYIILYYGIRGFCFVDATFGLDGGFFKMGLPQKFYYIHHM